MKPILLPYNNIYPRIADNTYLAPNCAIIGDVSIGEESNIWFNVTIRGDVASIAIGKRTNVQDGTVIHVTRGGGNTYIGNNVTIGHKALIHAATLEDNSFIGMGAVIMDGVIVESNAWVAAGSLVTNNKIIRSGEVWAGSPAKLFKKISEEQLKYIMQSADNYVFLAKEYMHYK